MDLTLQIVTTTIGVFGTVFGIWQKALADRRSSDIDKFKAINEGFERLYEAVNKEVNELKAEISALRVQVDKYKAEVTTLTVTEHDCQREVNRLRAENEKILKHLNMD